MIAAGEVLQAGSVQIVTDQTAYIPAGDGLTNGHTSVLAHATAYGPLGNIAPYAINGLCCRANILARNLSAFNGGRAARSYPVVQQGDLDTAGATLKTSLYQIIGVVVQAQIKPTETLITPLPCQSTPSSNHKTGEEVDHVNVTLSATCSARAYSSQMMTSLAMGQLAAKVGEGYALAGDVDVKVVHVDQDSLIVHLAGRFLYQFEEAEVTHMKHLIAGKDVKEATSTLLSQPGVSSVAIPGSHLPSDVQRIKILVVSYV